jgi:3-oxoacyl-(acyl-carrier-protein) synthase
MTSGDPDGTVLRRLLRNVVAGRSVDLIHAHGTGTVFNDPIELAAFEVECASDESPAPLVYSHKGALGHSLGASGLLSTALSCLMHQRGVVLPNPRTSKPLPTKRVQIVSSAKRQALARSLVTAAGFGGPVAVVSLISG